MKSLIQYTYSCSNAMYNYLHNGNDLELLINELKRIEKHAKDTIGGKDCNIWFRFFSNDTGATTIADIERDLQSYVNRKYRLECMEICTKDIDPNNELRVFYS